MVRIKNSCLKLMMWQFGLPIQKQYSESSDLFLPSKGYPFFSAIAFRQSPWHVFLLPALNEVSWHLPFSAEHFREDGHASFGSWVERRELSGIYYDWSYRTVPVTPLCPAEARALSTAGSKQCATELNEENLCTCIPHCSNDRAGKSSGVTLRFEDN